MGMDIIPGYWCIHGGAGDSASSVKSRLQNNKSYITGGFMWLYDDMRNLSGSNDTASYAEAINSVNPDK